MTFTFATTMGNLRRALDIAASERHSFINTFHKRCKMEADDRRRGGHARRDLVANMAAGTRKMMAGTRKMMADMHADILAGSRAFRKGGHAFGFAPAAGRHAATWEPAAKAATEGKATTEGRRKQ